LRRNPGFIDAVKEAYQSEPFPAADQDSETRLYDGFLNDADRLTVTNIRNADEARLATWSPYFHDERLPDLFVNYKARNFAEILSQTEMAQWRGYRNAKLRAQQPQFKAEMNEARAIASTEQQPLLDQLQAWHDKVTT
jgi:exodeoxyribonuclease-1